MSDIDNGTCTMCNLPVSYDETTIEDGGSRDDETCLRTKPYCTNEDEHVDWRATCLHVTECARKAETRIATLEALLREACEIANDLNGDNGDDEELVRRREQIAAIRRKGLS